MPDGEPGPDPEQASKQETEGASQEAGPIGPVIHGDVVPLPMSGQGQEVAAEAGVMGPLAEQVRGGLATPTEQRGRAEDHSDVPTGTSKERVDQARRLLNGDVPLGERQADKPETAAAGGSDEMPRFYYPEDGPGAGVDKQSAVPKFSNGSEVAVKRTSGEVELGWVVESTNPDGSVNVKSPDDAWEKTIRHEDLAAVQPKFTRGDRVLYRGAPLPDFRVVDQLGNGLVWYASPSDPEKMYKMTAAELQRRMDEITVKQDPQRPVRKGLGGLLDRFKGHS